ncbi:MAG: hypothetical protein RL190_1232 [Actinomycetota bacterium]
MADTGDRSRHWPAIERKHGQPVDHWLALVRGVESGRYADQMALLQEGHGFSRAHANAVVQYARGSTSSRRFSDLDGYLAGRDAATQATVRRILDVVTAAYPQLELVLAWNQPMLRDATGYVFGVSALKGHILIAPFDPGALAALRPRLEGDGYVVNRKTVRVPLDWQVDEALLVDLVGAALGD